MALQRQATRNHLTHQQTITSLEGEILTLQKQLTRLESNAIEEKEEEEEKEELSFTSVKTHLSPQPLTLFASQRVSHDHVTMATDSSLGSVTDEPDTAAAALVAAMATRPRPFNQQSQQPQEEKDL